MEWICKWGGFASGLRCDRGEWNHSAIIVGMINQAFIDYRQRILQALESRWTPPRRGAKLHAVVRFSVNREGYLTLSEVCRSSGDGTHDAAALALVTEREPFPPLPQTVGEKSIFAFSFDSD